MQKNMYSCDYSNQFLGWYKLQLLMIQDSGTQMRYETFQRFRSINFINPVTDRSEMSKGCRKDAYEIVTLTDSIDLTEKNH